MAFGPAFPPRGGQVEWRPRARKRTDGYQRLDQLPGLPVRLASGHDSTIPRRASARAWIDGPP
eukprot:9147469-Lingulodinium_polyedra.AAC.1